MNQGALSRSQGGNSVAMAGELEDLLASERETGCYEEGAAVAKRIDIGLEIDHGAAHVAFDVHLVVDGEAQVAYVNRYVAVNLDSRNEVDAQAELQIVGTWSSQSDTDTFCSDVQVCT